MVNLTTELVLGRGMVYFDRFAPGTTDSEGERYIGNTSTVQIGREIERVERMTSYRGQQVTKPGAVTAERHRINFITDNISIENISDWYGGMATDQLVQSGGIVQETMTVRPGRIYQLGKSFRPFIGLRHVAYVLIRKNGVPINGSNFTVDAERGRVEFALNAPDIAGPTEVAIQFDTRQHQRINVTSAPTEIYGSLRFVSDSAHGPNRDYFFPYVRLSPVGQIDLKGDEFQQMRFEATALRISPNTPQMIVDQKGTVGLTADEQAIIDEGLTYDIFSYLEDLFDEGVNDRFTDDEWAALRAAGQFAAFVYHEDRLHIITNTDLPDTLG